MADNKTIDKLTAASSAADTDNVVLGVAALAKRLTIALLRTAILKLTALAAITTVALSEHALIDEAGVPKKMTLTNLKTVLGIPQLLHVRDEKASGTDGGASATATWNQRDLNTVMTNEISGASLASDQIILPAGTYEITATAPAFLVSRHKLRLRNITDTSTELVGQSTYAVVTSSLVSNVAHIFGRFTLAGTKTLELQHYTELEKVANGLGVSTAASVTEVYADVQIRKVA